MIIFKDLSLDYFFLSETKLDESFPTAQFALEGYKIGSRNYRGKYGGDLSSNLLKMVLFVKQEYISDKIECICSEFTISKDKWIYFSIHRSPVSSNLNHFFRRTCKHFK